MEDGKEITEQHNRLRYLAHDIGFIAVGSAVATGALELYGAVFDVPAPPEQALGLGVSVASTAYVTKKIFNWMKNWPHNLD